MKLFAFGVLLVAAFSPSEASPCSPDAYSSDCYGPPPPQAVCACKPSNFSPKQALYQKFPLLYKLYAKKCKLYCSKVNGVTTCYPAPAPVAAPAPAPVAVLAAPAPPAASCSECAAAPPMQANLPPEVLRALFGGILQAQPNCPCCS